ncbi:MAG: hypothetical protein RL071_466 [Pseudomonadota bacterium]
MSTSERAALSFGGTGTALRACTRVGNDGAFEATTWVTLIYLPIWPLRRGRYRLLDHGWRFPARRTLWVHELELLPISRVEVARTYAWGWLGVPVGLWGPTSLLSLPGIVLGLPEAAAVGAALSSLWVIPFGLGALLWAQGQPWPARLPSARAPALLLALQQTGRRIWAAVGLVAALLSGTYALLVAGVELHGGAGAVPALLAALQSAAFIGALAALVGIGLWLRRAWSVAQRDFAQEQMGAQADPPPGRPN